MTQQGQEGEGEESRFSRQLPLFGEDGMQRVASSTVFIHGLNGLGVEIGNSYFILLMYSFSFLLFYS